MQGHQGGCALFWIQLIAVIHRQANAVSLKPIQLWSGIRHVGTSGVAKGIPASPVALGQHIPQGFRLIGGKAKLGANARVGPLSEGFSHLQVLYWLNQARRDLVRQSPRHHDGETRGTFALRSPVRPNPIGVSTVRFVALEGSTVLVRGLDCLDQTPLIDLKPDRCVFTPEAASDHDDGK